MQFYVTLTLDRSQASYSDLQAKMSEYVEDNVKAGSFIITGVLTSQARGCALRRPLVV